MKIICIVQARLASKRLPGKVLMDIAGKAMIAHVAERAIAIRGERIVIAIPPQDHAGIYDAVEDIKGITVQSYKGIDDDNVLGRFLATADFFKADAVIRITGDCPLLDPEFSRAVVRSFCDLSLDYATNAGPLSDGLDTEVIGIKTLGRAYTEGHTRLAQHVTSWIRGRPSKFRQSYQGPLEWWQGLKLSVDTQEDLDRVRTIYKYLTPGDFSLAATQAAIEEAERNGEGLA